MNPWRLCLIAFLWVAFLTLATLGFLLFTGQDYGTTEIRDGCVVTTHRDALGRQSAPIQRVCP